MKEVDKTSINAARYFAEASQLYAVRHPNVAEELYCSTTRTRFTWRCPSTRGPLRAFFVAVR